ncbi:DUF6444 domain-containing protein [Frankia sp. AgPm24]|uniref:DUF6444 domain-containing protein n=1 Tax=Frankia sp. AgPm24 TaxID=631128 RepID=UPI00200EDBB7|nr:DUF6444 domain-containing protein [Frankia sp. AgPm24]
MPLEEMSREELLAVVAAQAATLAAQAELIEELRGQVEALAAEVDRLGRAGSRNSGNSSLPPSSDGVLPGRAEPGGAPCRRGRDEEAREAAGAGRADVGLAGGPGPGRGAFPGRGV